MKLTGDVTTGLGKGAYFLSQDFYKNALNEKCGFIPFPGTLNIIVPKNNLNEINTIKENCKNMIKPEGKFGAVKYIKATLNEKVKGAILFPAKTTHEENYLEFIAPLNLRKELNLKDGDEVTLEIYV
ncbi:MAG: CTP-dependent riboflavin kinase [Methanobrevibacter sp.]|nr:CTP-dependent riboflavin kinase [Methanobrevibacter sp.]